MIETLESRQLCSGIVTVTTDYGPQHRLLIQGDGQANEVSFEATDTGGGFEGGDDPLPFYSLTVFNGRLVVDGVEISGGDRMEPSVSSVGRAPIFKLDESPLIDLGAGDDGLHFQGFEGDVFTYTDVLAGDGNDRVSADGVFYSLKIDTGPGNDRVSLRTGLGKDAAVNNPSPISGIAGDLNIFTGPGRDRVTLDTDDTFLVRGKLRVIDNSGSLQLSAHSVRAKHGATIATGNAADYLSFNTCFFGPGTVFSTRGGDDVITLRKTGFTQSQDELFLTGSGYDRLVYLTS